MATLTPSLPELLRLENQICFSIYAASRAITRAYRPLLEPLGLTYPQYLVLLVLWEDDGQTVNDLGRRLYLDSGTLTPLLKRMEAAGFLTRSRSRTDERKVTVSLGPRGQELRAQALSIPLGLIEASNLEAGDVAETKPMVDRLLTKLLTCSGSPEGEEDE